jgi:DNA replication protein DnaC
MTTDLITRLIEALEELRLYDMAAALRRELDEGPRPDDNRLDFLWRLLEPQLRGLRERRIERRLKEARFPASKSLDAFDWAFNPTIDRELIEQLATLDFVRQGRNVLCAGMSGTGKSHVCLALGHLACAEGLHVRYTTSAAMLDKLYASLATHTLQRALRPYVRAQLLLIDEVGIDRPERDTDRDASLFYKVVQARYEAVRSTVLTTNIAWEDWVHYLGDERATSAILDRLVHRGYTLRFEGKSYRVAEHQRLNRRDDGDATSNRPPGPKTH